MRHKSDSLGSPRSRHDYDRQPNNAICMKIKMTLLVVLVFTVVLLQGCVTLNP